MGIDVPTELRGDMAMAGEWTVTNTRVVDDTPKTDENGNPRVDALATGVRKRVKREGEEDEEEAMKGLFKKPRKWGRDTKQAPDDDAELEALLGGLAPTPLLKKEKVEDSSDAVAKQELDTPPIKTEPSEDDQAVPDTSNTEEGSAVTAPLKTEEASEGGVDLPTVVFKKRKPKNIRQK